MANEQNGGTRPRVGISAWVAVGLALGWLAILATFVRGVGNLLTAWAATISLAIVATRRRPVASAPASTKDHPAALTGPETPSSGISASTTAPQIPAGTAEMEQAATAGTSAESQEPGGQESTPDTTGHQANAAETPDSSSTSTLGSGAALGMAAQPTVAGAPVAEIATVQGLRVLTAAEVAMVLRVDIDAIIMAIGNGELPGNRIGSHWRVDQEALARWLLGTYRNPVSWKSGAERPALPS